MGFGGESNQLVLKERVGPRHCRTHQRNSWVWSNDGNDKTHCFYATDLNKNHRA